MRDNNYQTSAYQTRRQLRYQEVNKPTLDKKLTEQFLTQLTLCALIIGIIFGAQLLKLKSINEGVDKFKTAITYSPSLYEIASQAKDKTTKLIKKISTGDKNINNNEMPTIVVDDEVF